MKKLRKKIEQKSILATTETAAFQSQLWTSLQSEFSFPKKKVSWPSANPLLIILYEPCGAPKGGRSAIFLSSRCFLIMIA